MLLFADVAVAAPPATSERVHDAPAHPGLTAFDVQWFLEQVATGDAAALAGAGPLTGTGAKVVVPPHLLDAVDAAPAFAVTLAALADAHPGAPGARAWRDALARPLPPDLDHALSTVGQGVLGASSLVADGENLAGALLVQHALDRARPVLEKHAILFAYRDAFSGFSFDEDGTRALAKGLASARSAEDALTALGYARDVHVTPAALSAELAAVYARLGVPVTFDARAGLAAADALPADVRAPLARALAHVRVAMDLRDAAFADLAPWERAALDATGPVLAAARAPAPSRADLTLLSAYGSAVSRVDAGALADGVAHLVAASRVLESATPRAVPTSASPFPVTSVPLPDGPDAGSPEDASPRGRAIRVGGLVAEAGSARNGDVVVRVGPNGDAPNLTFRNAQVFPDAARGSLIVFEDANGNARPDAHEVVWASPALRDAGNDVVFRDPFGLVLVTGAGESVTTASAGGARVDVVVDRGNATLPRDPSDALSDVDARLGDAPDAGSAAWRPFARAYLRDLGAFTENATDAWPDALTLTVNPEGYQVLHWDLGGDDAYHTNAGGAGTRGVLAVTGEGAASAVHADAFAGPLPVALLVDAGGNDAYATTGNHSIAAANASLALLADAHGTDRFAFHGESHGIASAARAGVGVLLAGGPGARAFTALAGERALAFAESAGTALLVSAGGADAYRAGNESLAASRLGAVAALVDAHGDDAYASGNFSQAASSGGVAVLADAAGADAYTTRERGTSQGFAEPYPTGPVPCAREDACPQVLGPSRLALLVDASGRDAGACTAGALSNALLGRVGVARPLVAGPFHPAAGACVDADVTPAGVAGAVTVSEDPRDAGARVPPSFFTSAYGNFTLPGLFRVGTLGDDVVRDPFLVSVDVSGNDAYALGAVAVANATRAAALSWDLGFVAPVSVVIDADGADVFDPTLARADAPGAFGYADGGVAVQVHATAHRARVELDPARASEARGFDATNPGHTNPDRSEPATDENGSPLTNASRAARSRHVVDENRFLNVTHGLASAVNGGVALVQSDAVRHVVGPAPDAAPGASCRLACAARGGIALWLATGGPGDVVNATPASLGAVHDGPLGGVAVYVHRGGSDVFTGSNHSMGVIHAPPGARPAPAADAPERPRVALFVKDGWSPDEYAPLMRYPGLERLPRRDNASWHDADTLTALDAASGRGLHVAQGFDNLDWFVERRIAEADRGVAANTGPADPFGPGGHLAVVRETLGLHPVSPLPAHVPGLGSGSGGSVTGPDGVRPVTFARTAFSPVIDVDYLRDGLFQGANKNEDVAARESLSALMTFVLDARNPPAFTDATTLHGSLATTPTAKQANAIHRVELVVRGAFERWTECPDPARRDALDPEACVIARWDRDVHAPDKSPTVLTPGSDKVTSPTEFWIAADFNANVGTTPRPLFPPGPYHVTIRAFAARDYGVPAQPFGVGDALLDATAADAWNVTDDAYGYYGSSWHYARPVYNPPRVIADSVQETDSNGSSPFRVTGNVTEPVTFHVDFYEGRHVECNPFLTRNTRLFRWPAAPLESALHDDADAYFARGLDAFHLEMPTRDLPPGQYVYCLALEGKYSGRTSYFGRFAYVDPDAAPGGVDARGMPAGNRITRAIAHEGAFNLTVAADPGEVAGEGAPARTFHYWVQEDVLDPANPNVVLESFPWTYHGNVSSRMPSRWFVNDALGNLSFNNVTFQGNADPGPPRVYRVAVYQVDRAGNVRVPDPESTVPDGPDCVDGGRCAVFLFDVTPPRTRLALVDPAPEVATVRANATVELAVDASETPDVARVHVLVARGRPDAPPTNLSAFTPVPADAIDGNRVRWNASNVTHGDALYFLARGVDRVGNVEEKVDYDTRVLVDLEPPNLTAVPTVTARAFSATLAWSTDEPAFTRVLVNGDVVAADASRAGTVHEVDVTGLTPDAEHAVTIVTEDVVGNVAEHGPFTVRTNRAADVRVLALPATVASPVNVTWETMIVNEGLVRYEVDASLDGGVTFPVNLTPNGFTVFETGNGSHALPLDPRALPESANARVRVRAVPLDAPDADAIAVTSAFTLDGHAPVVNASAPRGVHASWANGSVNVTVTATDGGSGVTRAEWSVDNVTWHEVTGPLAFDASTTLLVRATDAAGHVADPVRVPVNIDRAPPRAWAVARSGPAVSAAVAVLDVHARDVGSGLARVTLASAARTVNLTASDFVDDVARVVWPLSAEEGPRRVRVTAWDAADNAASTALDLVVDRTPPEASARVVDRGLTRVRVALTPTEPVRVTGDVTRPDGLVVPLHGTGGDAPLPAFTLTARELVPGAWHTAHLTLTDAAGNAHATRVVFRTTPDVTPPSAAGPLATEPTRDGAIVLRWAPATDDAGIAHYEVWRDTARTRSTRPLATTDAPFFMDASVLPGVTYAYRVVPVDVGGNEGAPRELTVTSRTAPRVTNVTVTPSGSAFFTVNVNVLDEDGDAPAGVIVVGNTSVPLRAERADVTGRHWRLTALVPAPAERFDAPRGFHVRVEDAAFTTRHPLAGVVPFPDPGSGDDARATWLAALHPVPAAPALVAIAAVILAARARREGGGAS